MSTSYNTSRVTKLKIQNADILCVNRCGFYGNPMWNGFCSKCYKQQNKSSHSSKLFPASSFLSRDIFKFSLKPKFSSLNFDNRNKSSTKSKDVSNKSAATFLSRAGSALSLSADLSASAVSEPRAHSSASHSTVSIVQLKRQKLYDCLNRLSRHVREDVLTRTNNVIKQCRKLLSVGNYSNHPSVENDQHGVNPHVCECLHSFYSTFNEALYNSALYQNEAATVPDTTDDVTARADWRHTLQTLAEQYVCASLYAELFAPLSHTCEQSDLSLQSVIRQLDWVTADLLEVSIDERRDELVTFLMELCITSFIEIDGKETVHDKIHSISCGVRRLLDILSLGEPDAGDSTKARGGARVPSANELLPAVIYAILRSNPPRLHTNIQFITHYANPRLIETGTNGYSFTNLCCAVEFIAHVNADSFSLSEFEFRRYMSHQALPFVLDHSDDVLSSKPLQMLKQNISRLQEIVLKQTELETRLDLHRQNMAHFHDEMMEEFSRLYESHTDYKLISERPSLSTDTGIQRTSSEMSQTSMVLGGDADIVQPPGTPDISLLPHSLAGMVQSAAHSVQMASTRPHTAPSLRRRDSLLDRVPTIGCKTGANQPNCATQHE